MKVISLLMGLVLGTIVPVGATALAHDAIEEWLKGYDGYRGTIVFTDEDAERARIITLWDTAAAEVSSRRGRTEMRNRVVEAAGMSIAGVELYDVPVCEVLPA